LVIALALGARDRRFESGHPCHFYNDQHFSRKEEDMQLTDRNPAIRAVTVSAPPKPGDEVTLPAGLLFMNEYFAERRVTKSPTGVRVTARTRDEFYWRDQSGHACYARFAIHSHR
jgi:hypothetical protein